MQKIKIKILISSLLQQFEIVVRALSIMAVGTIIVGQPIVAVSKSAILSLL